MPMQNKTQEKHKSKKKNDIISIFIYSYNEIECSYQNLIMSYCTANMHNLWKMRK